MLTYPVSFLNAGGEYEEAIGRRFAHNSVMDKYTSRTERTLEVRQAEDFVEFLIRWADVDARDSRDDVTFPVRASIHELRWAMNTLRRDEGWHGFEGRDGGVIDFEVGLGTDKHTQVTASFGEEHEDFDDSMSVDLSLSDWEDLLALVEAMIEDWDERESRRVEITAPADEWQLCLSNLRVDGSHTEADLVESALRDAGLRYAYEGSLTLPCYVNEHDVDAIRHAFKVRISATFPEWMRIAHIGMEAGARVAATEILHTLSLHDYGHNDSEPIEVAFSLHEHQSIFPFLLSLNLSAA